MGTGQGEPFDPGAHGFPGVGDHELNAGWPGRAADAGAVPAPWLTPPAGPAMPPGRGGPPPGPGGPPPGGRPPTRNGSPALWIALVVIVLVAGGVVTYFLTSSGTSSAAHGGPSLTANSTDTSAITDSSEPSTSASTSAEVTTGTASVAPSTASSSLDTTRTVARQVDALLVRSRSVRVLVAPAINRISNCSASAADTGDLQHAADVRRDLIAQLDTIPFVHMPDGAGIKRALAHLFDASASADESYVAWGNDQMGCFGSADTNDASYSSARQYDGIADAAKNGFVATWNPIARRYGLHQLQQNQI